MTYLKTTPFAVLFLLLLCISCSKDDEPSPNGGAPENGNFFMMATIDGNTFSTNNVGVSEGADTEDEYFIIGTEIDGDWISFSLDGPIETGAFSPAEGENTALIYMQNLSGVWAAEGNLGSGVVTITDNTDTFVGGTFSFMGASPNNQNETVHVAAGSFKAQKN